MSDLFLVVCPRCDGCARVVRSWNATHRHWSPATLACGGCGLARRAEVRLCCARCPLPVGSAWRGPAMLSARCRCGQCGRWLEIERRVKVMPRADWIDLSCDACGVATRSSYQLHAVPLGGAAVAADLCFGQPLWLQTACSGETLWAFNPRHLAYLRAWITAEVRERGDRVGSSTIAARLPGWLKRTARPTALRAIGRLERRLAAG